MLSALKDELLSKTARRKAATPVTPIRQHQPIKTTYRSNSVDIPDTFLTTPAHDCLPVVATPIVWPSTPLPEYNGTYAVVLDNVLSPSECATLIALAEASVPPQGKPGGSSATGPTTRWGPALVNIGAGFEVLTPGYRNSDRIVWDCQEVVNRIWERCMQVDGDDGEAMRERLSVVRGEERAITGGGWREEGWKWEFSRVNDRMRFLRYGKGGFFKPHCDATYVDVNKPTGDTRTLFTVHVYLNDSKAEAGKDATLVGGATTFFSSDEKRRLDINPKAGRVLIFQHHKLLHSGDDVKAGVKYTMRTDILYNLIKDEE
ncbi:Prolyl 3-hydroxylase 2 [Madurella mycetomatis]|uniref:Prolyl 3-hydroxylase 2 n=1 Tax=Madurella mycetomatis TaxID=100816 RepID=A0A175W205_9PEZI|nr:Prolyl 3-hydroxylase 2 [Madurella mycetomatis]